MKNLIQSFVLLALVAGFASCENKTEKENKEEEECVQQILLLNQLAQGQTPTMPTTETTTLPSTTTSTQMDPQTMLLLAVACGVTDSSTSTSSIPLQQ